MDIDTLLKALEKDENEAIIDMTSSKIHKHNKLNNITKIRAISIPRRGKLEKGWN